MSHPKPMIRKKKELSLIEHHIRFPVRVFAAGRERRARARWLASGVNLHWTKWGAMGHSSPKLIASQRLTVSLHPPSLLYPLYPLPLSLSLSAFSPFIRSPSQPLFSFSLVLHIHIVLLASRRTRHVPATYIVPSNNVCPKGREITDFDGRWISRTLSADRVNRESTREKTQWVRPIFTTSNSVAFYRGDCSFYLPGISSMPRGIW